jgi:antitoxin FitA
MSNITIHQLEPELIIRLEQRAAEHGHSIEAEIESILHSVLVPETTTKLNLAAAIDRRFAHLDRFELPEITRDPMRTIPNFDETEV